MTEQPPETAEAGGATVEVAAPAAAPERAEATEPAEAAGAPVEVAPDGRGRRILAGVSDRLRDNLGDVATVLPLVLVAAFVARVAWLNIPAGGLIFDEAYYVNAARILLGWPVAEGAHYAGSTPGLDPNTEHPPLGKLLMAASMLVFGDNGIGWRMPSVVAGLLALVVVYRIVRTGGASAWLGVLIVALLAFDNLTLVHGRIGTLDMMALAPILLGSWLAMRGRWALAGLAVVVGLLVKLTAIYGVAAILLLYLLQAGGPWWRARRIPLPDLRGPATFVVTVAVVGLVGLGLLDARFSTYSNPIDHVQHMVSYGANLERPMDSTGFCPEADSRPWQWIFNECQIAYLRVDVKVSAGEEVLAARPTIDFRGALNPLLSSAIPLAALWVTWYAWRTRDALALWAVAWGAANYLPYVALALTSDRIMYIYYFLPALPAVAAGIAILLTRAGLPRFVRVGFIVAYTLGFAAYFPFREIP